MLTQADHRPLPYHQSADPISSWAYKQLAGSLGTGISITTAESEGKLVGCAVNSLTSVSLNPPLMSVCLTAESATLAAIRSTGLFGLSIPRDDEGARPQAIRFASMGPRIRDHGLAMTTPSGIPVSRHCVATAELSLCHEFPMGDHIVVLATPTWSCVYDGRPLFYWRSDFL